MALYIDREVAVNAIKKDVMGGLNYESILKRIPSADVQPVKHGRWIQLTQNVEPTALKCSLCGEISCCHGMYCPDCGARMDGEA